MKATLLVLAFLFVVGWIMHTPDTPPDSIAIHHAPPDRVTMDEPLQ